ncbi:PREDICTED: protein WVD2-like 4 isoform X2 [Nelumbo nucifera]|uniref:Protein WVD2-like 4 isoform X2 n=1 Tax=Nelumbo nucifera TaxID=4432 RepID=A0A1U7Z690_NELNU|nr:PREDICTED: protein WVD2-like 4 isoform X2 [Nelumbo nucifera]
MGESACLMQSFSHATNTSSNEAKQGNPIYALGESISFGRFMSESLDWEKWSSFSHNRYLEEVEKYSKPGSVAQKRAYFEARYKRIAAKKETALLEQANATANNIPQPDTEDGNQQIAALDTELARSNSHMAHDEPQEVDGPNSDKDSTIDPNGCNSIVERGELETSNEELVDKVIEDQAVEENQMVVSSTNKLGDAVNHNEITEVETSKTIQVDKSPVEEISTVSQQTLSSETKKKPSFSSSKSSFISKASKVPSPPLKYITPVHSRKEISTTPNSKNSARDLVDKKRSTPKSLHMSINLAPSPAGEIKKSSPVPQMIGNSRLTGNSSKTAKHRSVPLSTPTRASTNGLPKVSSTTSELENKRSKRAIDHIVSTARKANALTESLPVGHSKSLRASGNIRRPSIVSSPFTLRSDERAAKRKEKLEERFNANEAQKEKAETELRKLHQSLSFKAKPMPDFRRETELPKCQIKKIPLTRPRSPKLGRKPNSDAVQEMSSIPPRRPPVKNDNTNYFKGKSTRSLARSVSSLPKKNTHENASPNIQH